MSNYRPNLDNIIPLVILKPTYKNITGVNKKIYPTICEALNEKDEKGNSVNLFFGTFRTFGGTEKNINGVYSIEDTATIETWYRPDIKSDCKIAIVETKEEFDILNTPENINRRNQFLKFKVKSAKGGA